MDMRKFYKSRWRGKFRAAITAKIMRRRRRTERKMAAFNASHGGMDAPVMDAVADDWLSILGLASHPNIKAVNFLLNETTWKP
jgi:hypothetical protein